MDIQTIKSISGRDEYVLVPVQVYEALREQIERKLRDPVIRKLLDARADEETESATEKKLVAQARREAARGKTISHGALLRRLRK